MKKSFGYQLTRMLAASLIAFGILVSVLSLPQSAQASQGAFVLDNFSTQVYNRQDGNVNWTTDWIETNDDGIATGGEVLITVGGVLQMTNSVDSDLESIEREINMPINATATLTYNHADANLEAGDSLILEIYNGATWTTLQTYNGDVTEGLKTFDITSYRSANTRIRFRIASGFTDATEIFNADNVRISYWSPSAHTESSVFQTVQTYYLPVPENQGLLMLDTINADANDPMFRYVSITVNSNDTVIYYDHWEDDFEAKTTSPQQNTSEVWGDNNVANGIPPGYASDLLPAGSIILLNNTVPTDNLSLVDFDGGDKISSTNAISVTSTSWPSGAGTLHGGSVEILDTSIWGTRYDVPADSGDQANDFDYAGVAVMASQDNTQIFHTPISTGVEILVATINEGQGYLFDGGVADNADDGDVRGGDKIRASAPIQAQFLTGNIGSNYQSSWFTLYPFSGLSSDYYAPVDRNDRGATRVDTAVYLQNPNASPITVNWTIGTTSQTSLAIAAGSTARVLMTASGNGARFYTGTDLVPGPVFQAISVIDSNGQAHDWGYTLIPKKQLKQQAQVGWGVGRDPTSGTNPNENGGPVWVVAVGTGTLSVCVDYDGDGAAPNTDASTGSQYDVRLTLANLARAKIYDTNDRNQTGMLLFLCNGSQSDLKNQIAVAWGQDPVTASTGAPGLDVGTSVPPLPNFTAIKGAVLIVDNNLNTKFDIGDTFEYQIKINNVGALPIAANTIRVADIIPLYTTYVANSTYYQLNSNPAVNIPDSGSGTALPLDDGVVPNKGFLLPIGLPVDGVISVTFRVTIGDVPGAATIKNDAKVSGLDLTYLPSVEIFVGTPSKIGDFIWLDRDGDGVQDPGEPGIPGVTVELSDGVCTVGSTCPTAVTDANGGYIFTNLSAGTYTVIVRSATLPAGVTQTGDPDSACPGSGCNNQTTITASGAEYLTADFGYRGNASISDYVWNDINGNGAVNGSEAGIGGVTVWVDLNNDGVRGTNEPYDVTDANGFYSIGGLYAGTYTVRVEAGTVDSPVNGATPTHDLNGTGTPNVTSVSLSLGQNRVDVDWGYRFPNLDITKSSNIAGSVNPGDTAQYTITVTNNTATTQTGIAVTDILPLGTTYVANSTVATGYQIAPTSGTYRDTFDSIDYNGSDGTLTWPNSWQEVGEADGANTGYVRVLADGTNQYVLQVGLRTGGGGGVYANRSATRIANLSSCTSASLSLSYRRNGLEANDNYNVDISYNGGTNWTNLTNLGGVAVTDATYQSYSTSITAGNANTVVRLASNFTDQGGTDQVFVDDVQITCNSTTITATTLDNNPSTPAAALSNGVPSSLIVAADNFVLNPSQSMTVTYSVTINNPVALSNIDNTASVTSTQQPTPRYASVSDPVNLRGVIGDRVWLDEDSDGVQDAGESGIPNVVVELRDGVCTPSSTCRTTRTDSEGNYLFANVAPGSYTVAVISGLPAGLLANPTYDENGIGTPNVSAVTLTSGQEYVTADFGYNWATTPDVTNPVAGATGAIGDRVWIDADGDGVQDSDEPGLAGRTVTLIKPGADGIFGTSDDDSTSTPAVTTDANGNYIFDGLPAGAYKVQVSVPGGYNQTGDPDSTLDNQTTAPILLAPGDVYVNADFGYQPTSNYASIGDTLWLDTDRNNSWTAGEPFLAGVTVALIRDTDGDGIWDAGEPIIATDVTDANGQYQFDRLPASGTEDYLVWVNDTANVLDGLSARWDSDTTNPASGLVTGLGISAITDLAADNLNQDFAYIPYDHQTDDSTDAIIGDTIFLDRDGGNDYDAGEGLEGVTVELYLDTNADGNFDAGEPRVASVVTNQNGQYFFANLPAGNYVVKVDTSTLPGGLTNTVDPDTSNSPVNESGLTLASGQVNLAQDFGYRDLSSPNTVGGTLWRDTNVDGTLDADGADNTASTPDDEPGIVGVTVALYDNNGNLVATTTTDGSGNYSFPNLPDGTYRVDVVDAGNVLNGYWKSDGSNPGVNNNSQVDPYTITVSGGQTNNTGDFGYYRNQAAIGNFVWQDDGDGIQEGGEPGLAGVEVTLTVTWPNSAGSTTYKTVTDASGYYSFANLLLDENHDGLGGSGVEPAFSISVATPSGYTPTTSNAGGDDETDSDGTAIIALPLEGITNNSYDTGFIVAVGAVGNFTWVDLDGDGQQDVGEPGLAGVTVRLYTSANVLMDTTVSDATGAYSFVSVPPGDYYLVFTSPNGYSLTLQDQGADASDSDPNRTTGQTATFTVSIGVTDNTRDAGFYQPVTLGDYVWLDRNNNGVQDSDEPGIRGATVNLLDPGDNILQTVTTGVGGTYSFANLIPGSYKVEFSIPSLSPVTPDLGGDDALDSDANIATGRADVTLISGQTNNTIDSGFYTTRLDLGDLPNGYRTFFSPGPAHIIFPDGADADTDPDTTNGTIAVWLGTIVDTESNGVPGANASGDDAAGTTDDEDGLVLDAAGWTAGAGTGGSFPPAPKATITLNSSNDCVVNPAGKQVYYGFWIDWNPGDNLSTFDAFYSGSGVSCSPVSVLVDVPVPATYVPDSNVYMRLRASENPFGINDFEGTIVNGEVEDYWFTFTSGGITTPVTLSYFLAERQGATVTFDWSTATETGNVGFNLYVEQEDGTLRLINPELIASAVIDSLEKQDYQYSAVVAGEVFYIEDIDIQGDARRHGPFETGLAYGAELEMERIDQESLRQELDQAEDARQQALLQNSAVPAEALADPAGLEKEQADEEALRNLPALREKDILPILRTTFKLKVNQTGLYRVSYEMLRDAGLDLAGVPTHRITLLNRGMTTPIHIEGGLRFGPGSFIEFYGQALDTIYTDTNVYTLQVGNMLTRRVQLEDWAAADETKAAPEETNLELERLRSAELAGYYQETLLVNKQRQFANYAPGADTWYDTSMLAYTSAKSWNYAFSVDSLVSGVSAANLELVVWGVTNWPDEGPDHHLLVSLNGVPLADEQFDGLTEKIIRLELPAGLLREGANTLTLTLPGDTGFDWDMINFDRLSLTYPREFRAQAGQLRFTAQGEAFVVSNLPEREVLVYRIDAAGQPTRVQRLDVAEAGDGSYRVSFGGTEQPASYLVTTVSAVRQPQLEITRAAAKLNQRSDYLIIAHPNFIKGLTPLVAARRAQGLKVSVVDVNDLYGQYTHGIFDPQAIRDYIAYAARNLGTKYVLLVGGDTYDYRNYTGRNSLSFIPSLYFATGPIARAVPVDPLYTDLNGDNLPDLAIGRFPVRSQAELDLLVQKTLAYENKRYGQTALFATDKRDQAVSFKAISAVLEASLPSGWAVESVHLDDLAVTAARQQLLDAMNRGTALVTFTGHSGPTSWTFSSLFTTSHAAQLTNAGKPFVAVQWGCWNTYYVDPVNNYLVQSLLFSGDRGAAAALGAVTLTDAESERLLGELLTPRMVQPGVRIGDALQQAKAELAQTNPELLDVLLGWTLMGDPTLTIVPSR